MLPWEYRQRALSGTFYLQTALLTVAVWSAPAACRLWTRATACDPDASSLRRYGLAAVDGVALGAAVTLCLIYLRGQTAFIYFQF